MPYRLRAKMSDIHYFDIVDDLIMNFVNKHIDTPCASCPDRDETSALCDMCAANKYNEGKDTYKHDRIKGSMADAIYALKRICDAHLQKGKLCTSDSCPLFIDASDIVSHEFCSSPLCILKNLEEAFNNYNAWKEKHNEFKQQ